MRLASEMYTLYAVCTLARRHEQIRSLCVIPSVQNDSISFFFCVFFLLPHWWQYPCFFSSLFHYSFFLCLSDREKLRCVFVIFFLYLLSCSAAVWRSHFGFFHSSISSSLLQDKLSTFEFI